MINVGGDGTLTGGEMRWTFSSVAGSNGTATGWFNGTIPCTAAGESIVNDDYRVLMSDQGVGCPAGDPVALTVLEPTLSPDFERSAIDAVVGETIYFTDTSTTNGVPIVAWEWDFGDGSTHAFTQNASHAYTSDGTFSVRLTVTDACGYSETITGPQQEVPLLPIFLPLVTRGF